jgi:hypothetical protein
LDAHRIVLERLDSVPWGDLRHAYGSAADVPGQLRALTSPNDSTREEALSELFGNIWHQGTVYEATAVAVPFLVELATEPSVSGRADLLGLIGSIAESEDGPRTAHEEVLQRRSVLAELLADRQPLVRAAAAYVLGTLKEEATTIASRIRGRVDVELDGDARAGMFLGLAALGDATDDNLRWLERRFAAAPDERERLVTAAALAHSARAATPNGAIATLGFACDSRAKDAWFAELPWDLAPETLPRRALVAAGAAARGALAPILNALAATGDAIHASILLEDALAIVFGGDRLDTAPPTLDIHQRRVLVAALDMPVVWRNPRVFDASLRRYSVPTTRDGIKGLVERASAGG